MTQRVWLGLGSNQGDRLDFLRKAVNFVDQQPGMGLLAFSPIYETQYVGPGQQDNYLNACLLSSESSLP